MRVLIVDKLSADTPSRLEAAGCAVTLAVGAAGEAYVTGTDTGGK